MEQLFWQGQTLRTEEAVGGGSVRGLKEHNLSTSLGKQLSPRVCILYNE